MVPPMGMAEAWAMFMEENRYVDPWRFYNPSAKEFSFFSNVHQTFSRIDYFFLDSSLVSEVKSVEYLAIVISDHTPLTLEIHFPNYLRDRPPWKFNSCYCYLIRNSATIFQL